MVSGLVYFYVMNRAKVEVNLFIYGIKLYKVLTGSYK